MKLDIFAVLPWTLLIIAGKQLVLITFVVGVLKYELCLIAE
jgi:hypothetical protein